MDESANEKSNLNKKVKQFKSGKQFKNQNRISILLIVFAFIVTVVLNFPIHYQAYNGLQDMIGFEVYGYGLIKFFPAINLFSISLLQNYYN
jgi:hypothetical protein